MSTRISRTLAMVVLASLAAFAEAQLPRPPEPIPPPLPDEIRPAIVAVAPPAPRVDVVVVRPDPAHVWARGYWDWSGESWAWVPGRWVRAPAAGARWVPAQYSRVSTGWRYVPSHWSNQRVVAVEEVGRGGAVGHAKAKGKGHRKGKGKGHAKHH